MIEASEEDAPLPLEEPKAEPPSQTAIPGHAEAPKDRRREEVGQEAPDLPSQSLIAGDEEKITKIDVKIDAACRAKINAALSTIRKAWHRGHTRDDTPKTIGMTRSLLVKAVREGSDLDVIVAGAKEWVAAFAGELNFLPHLPDWLTARSYEKPPPQEESEAPLGQRLSR